MKILLLGGGRFLGKSLAATLADAGHHVTVAHRGHHPRPDDPRVRFIPFDRTAPSLHLPDEYFDVAIDTACYTAADARAILPALPRWGLHIHFSSSAVYEWSDRPLTESSSCLEPASDALPLTAESLGRHKRAAEIILSSATAASLLILRCTALTGPGDRASRAPGPGEARIDYDAFSPRFPYWPLRFLRPGPVLIPIQRQYPFQVLDCRDVVAWLIRTIPHGTTGILNLGAPAWTLNDLLLASRPLGVSTVEAPDELLLAYGVSPIVGLPYWVPDQWAQAFPPCYICSSNAASLGFESRSLKVTVSDVRQWATARPEVALGSTTPTLPIDKETDILRFWSERSS